MADPQAQLDLRRRARRRLIGAIALVLALVIIPPWIMDLEPKAPATKLRVEIPGQDSGKLKPPAPPPKAPAADAPATKPPAAEAAKPAEPPAPPRSVDARTVASVGGAKPPAEPAPAAKPPEAPRPAEEKPRPADDKTRTAAAKAPETTPKPEEAARADAVLNATESFVVPLGSFAQPENVRQLQARLSKEGISTYTEQVKTAAGEQTRVRAGPFASRDAAEKTRERLKGLGIDAGNVVARQ